MIDTIIAPVQKISSRARVLFFAVMLAGSISAQGMAPPIKSILKKSCHKQRAKRVAFKARTIYVCWHEWRRPLFTDSCLPLAPLFDSCLVHDWGVIEVDEL